jgi:hypothetical protein
LLSSELPDADDGDSGHCRWIGRSLRDSEEVALAQYFHFAALSNRDERLQNSPGFWVGILSEFAQAMPLPIEKKTNEGIRQLIECNFSNSTAIDLACSHIALMCLGQAHMDYEVGADFPVSTFSELPRTGVCSERR